MIENLQYQADYSTAVVELIRERMGELLGGDYMPTPHALNEALFPYSVKIENRIAEIREEREGRYT